MLLYITDNAAQVVRQQHFRRQKMRFCEGALAAATRADKNNEREIW
jgi:hypothetical protein